MSCSSQIRAKSQYPPVIKPGNGKSPFIEQCPSKTSIWDLLVREFPWHPELPWPDGLFVTIGYTPKSWVQSVVELEPSWTGQWSEIVQEIGIPKWPFRNGEVMIKLINHEILGCIFTHPEDTWQIQSQIPTQSSFRWEDPHCDMGMEAVPGSARQWQPKQCLEPAVASSIPGHLPSWPRMPMVLLSKRLLLCTCKRINGFHTGLPPLRCTSWPLCGGMAPWRPSWNWGSTAWKKPWNAGGGKLVLTHPFPLLLRGVSSWVCQGTSKRAHAIQQMKLQDSRASNGFAVVRHS